MMKMEGVEGGLKGLEGKYGGKDSERGELMMGEEEGLYKEGGVKGFG